MLIPRVFHRVWFGGPMPLEYVRYGATWLEQHPGWQMIHWSEDGLPGMDCHPNFHRAKTYSEKSDFYRHAILTEFGGVYLDTDFECFKNIEPLLDDVKAFAASENNKHISCGIMGCVPGHPFFKMILGSLLDEKWSSRGDASHNCGPQFVTRIADQYGLRQNIEVFGPELFYPVSYEETYTGNPSDYPAAYATHHWAASWLKGKR